MMFSHGCAGDEVCRICRGAKDVEVIRNAEFLIFVFS